MRREANYKHNTVDPKKSNLRHKRRYDRPETRHAAARAQPNRAQRRGVDLAIKTKLRTTNYYTVL